MEEFGISEEQYDEAYSSLIKYEQDIIDHNNKFIEKHEIEKEDLIEVLDNCDLSGKMEIVEEPKGEYQKIKYSHWYNKLFVDQWSIGTEGDSYEGYIYVELDDKHWISIPFKC